MGLYHVVVIAISYLAGFFGGIVVARLVPFFSAAFWQLVCGLLAVLVLPWPIYRAMGLLPPPPRCPNKSCGSRRYRQLAVGTQQSKWKCEACGQVMDLNGTEAVFKVTDGEVAVYRLLHPKFIGIWRRRKTTP
jgi:hypothetical protein